MHVFSFSFFAKWLSKCEGYAMYTEKNMTHWRYQSFYFLKNAFCGEKEVCLLTVTTSLDRNRCVYFI
jgi:hypothetical protein